MRLFFSILFLSLVISNPLYAQVDGVEAETELTDLEVMRGIEDLPPLEDRFPPPVTDAERWGDGLGPDHVPAPVEAPPKNPKLEGHEKRDPGDGYDAGEPRDADPTPQSGSGWNGEGSPPWRDAWQRFNSGEIDADEYKRLEKMRFDHEGAKTLDDFMGPEPNFGITQIDGDTSNPKPQLQPLEKESSGSITEQVESVMPIG